MQHITYKSKSIKIGNCRDWNSKSSSAFLSCMKLIHTDAYKE